MFFSKKTCQPLAAGGVGSYSLSRRKRIIVCCYETKTSRLRTSLRGTLTVSLDGLVLTFLGPSN